MANKKEIGNLGEDIALKYLENLGFTLLERNFIAKKTRGEIDLVMTKGLSLNQKCSFGAVLIDDTHYKREISFIEDIFI